MGSNSVWEALYGPSNNPWSRTSQCGCTGANLWHDTNIYFHPDDPTAMMIKDNAKGRCSFRGMKEQIYFHKGIKQVDFDVEWIWGTRHVYGGTAIPWMSIWMNPKISQSKFGKFGEIDTFETLVTRENSPYFDYADCQKATWGPLKGTNGLGIDKCRQAPFPVSARNEHQGHMTQFFVKEGNEVWTYATFCEIGLASCPSVNDFKGAGNYMSITANTNFFGSPNEAVWTFIMDNWGNSGGTQGSGTIITVQNVKVTYN